METDLPYFSPEKDRHGNDRVYVRRNGKRVRMHHKPGTVEFVKEYFAALDQLGAPPLEPGTR